MSNQGNNFGSKNTIFIYRYLELYYLYDLNCLSILIMFLTKVLIMQLQWRIFFLWKSGALARSNFCQLLALRDSQVQHKSFKTRHLFWMVYFYYKLQWLEVIFQSKYKVKTLLHLLINSTILADRTHFLIHTF